MVKTVARSSRNLEKHVAALRNPTRVFFINCVSKTMVLFRTRFGYVKKTSTFCNCFYYYSLGEARLVC